jgi:integrase
VLTLDDHLVQQRPKGEPSAVIPATSSKALGEVHADSGYVANNEAGEPYAPDSLTRMWHKLTKAAGVRRIRLHDARHSCGTALHLGGVPMAVIAKWLGHADAATTARIYAHSQDEALRAAGAMLGQVIMPSSGHTSSTNLVTSS